MLAAWVRACAARPWATVVVWAAAVAASLLMVRQLPMDAMPDVTDVRVGVVTTSPGLSAATIERYPCGLPLGRLPSGSSRPSRISPRLRQPGAGVGLQRPGRDLLVHLLRPRRGRVLAPWALALPLSIPAAIGFIAVGGVRLVPMALATHAGSETQRPLATVVIGGIVASSPLTVGMLPLLPAPQRTGH